MKAKAASRLELTYRPHAVTPIRRNQKQTDSTLFLLGQILLFLPLKDRYKIYVATCCANRGPHVENTH